jgi:predicted component of type VI protein secretion system
MARLRLKYHGQDVARLRSADSVVVGRHRRCHLVVADPKGSRQHCTIDRRDDEFVLWDHSTNGTYVTVEGEEEILIRREPFTLRRHGWISIGQPRDQTAHSVEYFCE